MNLQQTQSFVSREVTLSLLAMLNDLEGRGLMSADHDGVTAATAAKKPYDWLCSLPFKDGEGRVEIRVREPNKLLEEEHGCLETAVYVEASNEELEVVCFWYGVVGGLHVWLMKTDRTDPRFKAFLEKTGLELDFFDCLPAVTEPNSDSVHKAIWSFIGPLLASDEK